jgi:hypothetical protein
VGDVDVVGVHPVPEAPVPCHLIELRVCGEGFDLNDVTQEQEGVWRDDWQSPWDEKLLDWAGETVLVEADDFKDPGIVPGDEGRVVFFFHHLDTARPLKTGWADVHLPPATPRPDRMASIQYEQP